MRIEIKKSWFDANWNKPNRMKRHMKRYNMKSRNVSQISSNAHKYNLTMPEEFSTLVYKKIGFYDQQRMRLQSMINACFTREINEENKSKIIDDIFNGKRYYAIYTDEKGIRYHSSFPPKSFFKKIKEKIGN
jgi:hypothetical protein